MSLIDINNSSYGFKPDVKNNSILYGLKAVSKISPDIIDKIIENRPYNGLADFLARCPISKVPLINLIKAGAFDEVDKDFNNRTELMAYCIYKFSEPKKRLTLQNFNGLIQNNLIPDSLELNIRVYNFNKYLKRKGNSVFEYYKLDEPSVNFIERFFGNLLDNISSYNNEFVISKSIWDKVYKTCMVAASDYLKENQQELLQKYNTILFKEMWDKYAFGNISHWEMDSLCFYYNEHELAKVNKEKYGVCDFRDIPSEEIDYFYKRSGHDIPIYKLRRIIGCVIAKNDTRHSISLLTTTGVISVKFTSEYYAMFKKQISQVQEDGTKKVIEKGWFGKGNLIMVQGFRREDQFVAKSYKNSGGHQLYHIDEVIGDEMKIRHERFTTQGCLEEDYDE